MRMRRSTRLHAFDYLGLYRYFVTICTERRRKCFTDRESVELVHFQLMRTADESGFAVVAYCFMPDHLHGLVAGTTDASDFCAFIRTFKQRSGFYWKQKHGATLWERSYFEHVLRDEEDSVAVARYIVGNPVRAGLVKSPADYPYSGSTVLGMRDLLESIRQT